MIKFEGRSIEKEDKKDICFMVSCTGVSGHGKTFKDLKIAPVYRNFDTGERWTELELIDIYEQTPEVHEDYPTWESYLEHMLNLGKQGIGGLVED